MTNKLRLMPANRGAQCIPGTDSVRQGAVQIGFKCNQRNFWRPEFQAWSYVTVGGRLSGTVPEIGHSKVTLTFIGIAISPEVRFLPLYRIYVLG